MGLTENQTEKALQTLAPQIASELSALDAPGWSVKTRDYDHYLQLFGPGGEVLGVSANRWKHRFGISGSVSHLSDTQGKPCQLPYHSENPSITVSADKAPLLIAADIVRRVLPGYRLILKAVQSDMFSEREEAQLSVKNAAVLVEIFGCPATGTGTKLSLNTYRASKMPNEFWADIAVEGDRVDVSRLNLSAEEARVLFSALVDLRSKASKAGQAA